MLKNSKNILFKKCSVKKYKTNIVLKNISVQKYKKIVLKIFVLQIEKKCVTNFLCQKKSFLKILVLKILSSITGPLTNYRLQEKGNQICDVVNFGIF